MARDQDQDQTIQDQHQDRTVQDQGHDQYSVFENQDQDHQKTAASGLEIKTMVSRTTNL